MRILLLLILITILVFNLSPQTNEDIYRVNKYNILSSNSVDMQKLLTAKVIRVIDGDTLEIEFYFTSYMSEIHKIEKVRLIGVDTPETVHPSKKVQYYGKEASNYTKTMLLNHTVLIAFDYNLRDVYHRLLVYIYINNECFNANLIKNGYGFAYTKFPFQFKEEFKQYQEEAKLFKRGLWK